MGIILLSEAYHVILSNFRVVGRCLAFSDKFEKCGGYCEYYAHYEISFVEIVAIVDIVSNGGFLE